MQTNPDQPKRAVIELIDAGIPSRRQPDTLTVTGVNWTVFESDFWVIGGLEGSGKSDLISAAAGLSQPVGGRHRLFGHEVAPMYASDHLGDRLRVGLVFGEGGRLFNHLTVGQNVALPLEYHRPGETSNHELRVTALLEAIGLGDGARQFPSHLNRGWRQRVALARALALKPEVLLLDNPLAGLDPQHTRWWIDFLTQFSSGHPLMDGRPMTLVICTDDLRPWRQPNRSFAFLEDNRFIPLDDPFSEDVSGSPALRELLAVQPFEI